jgi:hypothetical protein
MGQGQYQTAGNAGSGAALLCERRQRLPGGTVLLRDTDHDQECLDSYKIEMVELPALLTDQRILDV